VLDVFANKDDMELSKMFFLHFEKSDIEDLPLCNFETTHRGSGIAIYVSDIHSRIMHVVPTKIT